MAEMDKHYEQSYHALEEGGNWWFAARQDMVCRFLTAHSPEKNISILDIGCGGGGLLRALHMTGFHQIFGCDVSPEAVTACTANGLAQVLQADAEKHLPYESEQFDVGIASDVLEHLHDPVHSLQEWQRVLKPGGKLLIFVPAFPFLWSDHDVINHHVQRFTMRTLTATAHAAAFTIAFTSYWNMLLFLPHALFLKLHWGLPFRIAHSAQQKHNTYINRVLFTILTAENSCILKRHPLPFGVNIFAVLEKSNRSTYA